MDVNLQIRMAGVIPLSLLNLRFNTDFILYLISSVNDKLFLKISLGSRISIQEQS